MMNYFDKALCIIFMLFWTLVEGQSLSTGVCETLNHTAFQLQLVDPIPDENKILIENTDVNSCSQLCCDHENCDVALFADESCVLVNCLDTPSESCQPAVFSSQVDPFVAKKITTLIYIKKRNAQDDLIQSNIFDTVLEEKSSDTLQALNVNPTDASQNNINRLNEDKNINKPKLNASLNSNSSLHDHISSDEANISQTNTLTSSPEIVTTATTSTPTIVPTTTTPALSATTSSTASTVTTTITVSSTQNSLPSSTTTSATTASSTLAATTTSASTTQSLRTLVITIVGNTIIQLPTDSVVLHAEVNGTAVQAGGYTYKWVLISHPKDYEGEEATLENRLHLENLKAGSYQYEVQASDIQAYGEAYVNITVKKPVRVNIAPVAIVTPVDQEITLPNDGTILDGSESHDDDGIATFLWEMNKKPIRGGNEPWERNDQRTLELKDLVAGRYEFKLTVTDTDGVSNSTNATVKVNEKIDRPPIADAGSNRIIHLPQNFVVLYANNSKDDYGIVGYKWTINSDKKDVAVDMTGAHTSTLHLSNLEVGIYEFLLTVTDVKGQEDTATVIVNVQPASNHPPKANAGQDNQFFIPLDESDLSVNLDGSKSSDDKNITTILWTQTSGPAETTIANPNSITTSVSGLNKVGNYVFVLTVGDAEGEKATDDVTIIVNEIKPPVADAGPDKTIHLPDDVVSLSGENSRDDYGIKSFSWARDQLSPASGRVVNGSDVSSTLVVQGLTKGKYTFHLTVTNIRGKSSTDDVVVQVKANPHLKNLVELHLGVEASDFTEAMKGIIAKQIPLLLSLVDNEEVIIQSVYPEHRTEHLVLLFYIEKSGGKSMEAIDVVTALNEKLKSGVPLFDVDVVLVDTYVCENNCSGHGICHSGSKLCECDTFWMQNFFRFYMGDKTSNCDWSVLYFVITCFIIVCVIIAGGYACFIYCVRRRGKAKGRMRRRRKNYIPLSNGNADTSLSLKPNKNGVIKNGLRKSSNTYRSNALMRSMTSSSEDETLYEKQKLLKSGPKKSRSKPNALTGPLVDIEAGHRAAGSEDEFDGTGLDKFNRTGTNNTSVALYGRKISEEDVL